jgi:HD-GYP domain-containing protein (c-di-GMP phosphodiesterase class II)
VTAPVRLADLLASVSLVSDLGFALPAEESMRTAVIGADLADRAGLGDRVVSDVLYTALLQHLGCTGYAHETAAVYGDEMVVNAAAARTDTNDPRDGVDTFLRAVVRGRAPLDWVRVVGFTALRGDRWGRQFATARCEVGRETARRVGLGDDVRRALHEVAEAWNGRGSAMGLRGEDISVVARVATVAATAARFDAIGGAEMAREAVRRRAGGELDPTVASAFVEHGSSVLSELASGDPRALVLAAEPRPVREIAAAELVEAASAVGDVADLKSTYTLGHAGGVAALATAAAARAGLDADGTERLHVAALLHDVGRVGVSTSIWERPGALTAGEWEQVRLHAYQSERILGRSEALRPMATIAGMHHERLDGSGYHRGSTGREIGIEARLLAAADAFAAMTSDRPHRPALEPETAARGLDDEVVAGRLDGDAVRAVVESAGLSSRASRATLPAGLSQREAEVLVLVARGLSNRQIADRLVVSPRTAEHHVQHIYGKIGASSRAAAALFAMEHGLVG